MSPNHIRAGLIRKGIRQADVARDLNLSRKTVNSVICRRGSSRTVAERIAELLDRPLTVVFPEYARN